MKAIFTTLLFFVTLTVFGQRTVTLTEDLILTETLVLAEDTRYEGNGFSIICKDCSPAISVTNGATVHFQNVLFPRTYRRWMAVRGNSSATWESPRMRGHFSRSAK